MATMGRSTLLRKDKARRMMWAALIVLCVIGSAAAIRRMVALAYPMTNGPSQLVDLDAVFVAKASLTLAHLIPALALMFMIPFQFSRTFRIRHLKAHRWIGRVTMLLGLVVGISGLALLKNPVGGVVEVTAILFFDALFLVALAKAYVHARRRAIVLHREWVIRAMSVAVGVATVRPIMGAFFATASRTGMTPHDFFGIAFWIGLALTSVAGEVWIRYTRHFGRCETI
ncbi:MAG TPA: DUF2306 domain-containing protein [Candidatus Angelobacter sp.]|jgi:hypothetical protein|nr:DUF2306 domain-containing protein [Candidatus Angelobacter sp.]